jgi:hypothetical protein
MRNQQDKMKIGMGMMTFKPKLIMHTNEPQEDSGRPFVIMKPCGICNQGFHCMDVVVTSCKHTFHPFCLSVMIKESNRCCVCNVRLHFDWWTSWGFREVDEKLTELAKKSTFSKLKRR